MTDHTRKKPRRESGVNADIPDLTAWDHKPGDRDPRWYLGRGTDEETVLSSVNQPSSYERLADEEKAALGDWIRWELVPSSLTGPHASYSLKHILQRLTGVYVTNGVFKGAMLAAGFEPVDRHDLNWQFSYRLADPKLRARSIEADIARRRVA